MSKKYAIMKSDKINNNHSTFTEYAGKVMSLLVKEDLVRKIVLGPIITIKGSGTQRAIKLSMYKNKPRLVCRDTRAIQHLYVLGATLNELKEILSPHFEVRV